MSYPKITNSRVLVTGGAGFIGSNLCEHLLQHSNEVICLDNFSKADLLNALAHNVRGPIKILCKKSYASNALIFARRRFLPLAKRLNRQLDAL